MRKGAQSERASRRRVYGVITADLVRSRRIGNRARAQDRLFRVNRSLNAAFKNELIAPFMVTLGDEVQGVIKGFSEAGAVVLDIHRFFHPKEVTVGIGLGEITTRVSRKVTEMDGPAFVNSREAVEAAKKDNQEVMVRTGREEVDTILNSIYALLGGIKAGWTEKQWQRINLYRQLETVERVGRRLGVSKQAISGSIRNTLWHRVLSVEAEMPRIYEVLVGVGSGRA